MSWWRHGVLILNEDTAHLCVFRNARLYHTFVMREPEYLTRLLRRLKLVHMSVLLNPLDIHVKHVALESLKWMNKHRVQRHALVRERGERHCTGILCNKQRLTSVSMKESARLQSWLNVMQQSNCAIKGCHLLPVEAAALLDLLRPLNGCRWDILVSRHGNNMRHSIFKERQFIMTRFVPALAADQGREGYEETLRATSDYLAKTYGAAVEEMHFFMLDIGESTLSLSFSQASFYSFHDLQTLIKKAKSIKDVESLFAAAFIRQRQPLMQLRCAQLLDNHRRYRKKILLQNGLTGCVVVSLFLGLALISKRWIEQDVRSASLTHPTAAKSSLSPPTHIDALMFRDKQHWALWVGGKRYTPETPLPGFAVEDVSAHVIRGEWCEEGICQKVTLGTKGADVKKQPKEDTEG